MDLLLYLDGTNDSTDALHPREHVLFSSFMSLSPSSASVLTKTREF